jgi:hypothetical protein
MRKNNDEVFVVLGELLRIHSDELRLPQAPVSKRNLRVTANGNCAFVGKSIRCESNELLVKDGSDGSSFHVTLNGNVIVSVGNATFGAEAADVSHAVGSYRIRGDFTVLPRGGGPSHPTEPAAEQISNEDGLAPAR